jgi:hypothetical protein
MHSSKFGIAMQYLGYRSIGFLLRIYYLKSEDYFFSVQVILHCAPKEALPKSPQKIIIIFLIVKLKPDVAKPSWHKKLVKSQLSAKS